MQDKLTLMIPRSYPGAESVLLAMEPPSIGHRALSSQGAIVQAAHRPAQSVAFRPKRSAGAHGSGHGRRWKRNSSRAQHGRQGALRGTTAKFGEALCEGVARAYGLEVEGSRRSGPALDPEAFRHRP